MIEIVRFVASHGYSVLFAAVFVRQIGLPIPGFLFLLAAGALAAAGKLHLFVAIALGASACVLADWLWYEAGRLGGDKVLHFIHRFTRDPDLHDRRAKRMFSRYGVPLLLVAKFVPGLDAIAPPLTGMSGTSRIRFLIFESIGAGLYSFVYGGLGYTFSHDLNRAAAFVSRAGRFSLTIALIGICVYFVYRLVQGNRSLRGARIVRLAPTDPFEYEDSGEMRCGTVGREADGD
jgi:membrane protein DedA with SNARE-associated domain